MARTPTVILCGGQGTRIREVSELLPKPMIPLGGRPILWHVMKLYAHHGLTDFILCLGYKGWLIKEFFLNFHVYASDFTLVLGQRPELTCHGSFDENDWRVTLAETGERSLTGHRLWRVRPYLQDCEHFCLTYGDGVADLDLNRLLDQHRRSGLVGTVTGVHTVERFGQLDIAGGRVNRFLEKPARTSTRINGGFMVFDARRVWDYLTPEESLTLEGPPLARMALDGQLGVYEHDGYWQCMDTPREYSLLNELWDSGEAPWKIWRNGPCRD